MKVNHKLIITVLKTVTIVGFFIALAYKLYNIYTYGGTTKPTPTNDKYENDEDGIDEYNSVEEYPEICETKASEPYDG